jgi:CDP-2,3-bis-(O-geranylgeranyl)-sn-glycerol synthase
MPRLKIFKLVVLVTIANGAPIVGKLLGRNLNGPLDRGVVFVDGRPIFGASKTIQGIIVSLLAASATAPLLGFAWTYGLVIASAAMAGDLLSSFSKRRLRLPSSSRATGLDQIPEVLLPAVAIRSRLGLSAFDVVAVVILFFLGQTLLSRVLFRLNIRKHPY